MPRYYFHFLDLETANLVRDSAGVALLNGNQAKREAVSLARDIRRHPMRAVNWQVVVTDATASVILRVPLSKVKPRKFAAAFNLIRRIALYEPRLGPHVFTLFLTAAVIAVIMESFLFGNLLRETRDGAANKGVYRLTGESARVSGTSVRRCQ